MNSEQCGGCQWLTRYGLCGPPEDFRAGDAMRPEDVPEQWCLRHRRSRTRLAQYSVRFRYAGKDQTVHVTCRHPDTAREQVLVKYAGPELDLMSLRTLAGFREPHAIATEIDAGDSERLPVEAIREAVERCPKW